MGRRRRPALVAGRRPRPGRAGDHPTYGELAWELDVGPDGVPPDLLFCENDTNLARLYGTDTTPPHPKDGINDHVVAGCARR